MSEAVLTEQHERVLVVTLNRPEAKNAVNQAVAEGVAAALDELDGNDALRVGVLTGAGGTFCAGMDLKAFLVRRGADHRGAWARRDHPAPTEQAGRRRRRGLGAGRWLRDHARLRPGGGVADARGSAYPR